jgi:hypothetical protein
MGRRKKRTTTATSPESRGRYKGTLVYSKRDMGRRASEREEALGVYEVRVVRRHDTKADEDDEEKQTYYRAEFLQDDSLGVPSWCPLPVGVMIRSMGSIRSMDREEFWNAVLMDLLDERVDS